MISCRVNFITRPPRLGDEVRNYKMTKSRVIANLDKWSTIFIKGIVVSSSLVIIGALSTQVILRFLGQPLLGLEEMAILIVLWLWFGAAAHAAKVGFSISAGVLPKKASVRKRVLVAFSVFSLVTVIVFGCLTIEYCQWTIEANVQSVALRIPIIYSVISVLLGFLLVAAYLIRDLVRLSSKKVD